jgi:site-specific DNA-methyltransferase (adenine-specific)
MPTVTLHLGDCLEYMRTLEDGCIDAVVTDPPYGINLKANYLDSRKASQERDIRRHAWFSRSHKPISGDDRPFDPNPFLSFPIVMLWGANAYADQIPPSYSWLVWDKRDGRGANNNFSDCELCWCNGVPFSSVRIFRHLWTGYQRDSEIGEGSLHPTQKPVSLMKWCMAKAKIPAGATVFDPFMGSGSTGVACIKTGRNFIGCEIDPTYYAIAEKRIAEAQMQLPLLEAAD